MITSSLTRQAPPGLNFRAPARTTELPTDSFTASAPPSDDDKSRLVFAGVGLVVAVGAAAGGIWVSNHVPLPEAPPIQIEAPSTHVERVKPQPIVPHYEAPRPTYQQPVPAQPRPSTRIDSNGTVTVPLGNTGVSVDTEGRTSVQLGNTTLRSDGVADVQLGDHLSIRTDGTTGFRLNDNMTLRSDGTVEWNFGGRGARPTSPFPW